MASYSVVPLNESCLPDGDLGERTARSTAIMTQPVEGAHTAHRIEMIDESDQIAEKKAAAALDRLQNNNERRIAGVHSRELSLGILLNACRLKYRTFLSQCIQITI